MRRNFAAQRSSCRPLPRTLPTSARCLSVKPLKVHIVKNFTKRCWLFLACHGIAFSAYAAHPLVSDDAQTQGQNGNQIEINMDWASDAGQRSRISTLTYTRGINDTTDVYLNIPNTWRAPDAQPSGLNDIGVGLKWRFFEQDDIALGIKPEWVLSTGDETKGLGNGKDSYALTLIAELKRHPFVWLANIQQTHNRYKLAADREQNRRTTRQYSIGVLTEIAENTNFIVDIGQSDAAERAQNKAPRFVVVGLIYAVDENLDLDVGYKKGLNSIETDRQLGAGVTWRFK